MTDQTETHIDGSRPISFLPSHGALAPTVIVQPKPGAYGNIFFYPQNECASVLAGIAGNKTLTRSTLRSAERMGLAIATVHMGQTIPTTYEALAKEYPETN